MSDTVLREEFSGQLGPVALPAPGTVQLHLISLECSPTEMNRLEGFLSDAELQNRRRLLDPARRQLALASRGILREVLASALGQPAEDIALCQGASGKPRLSNDLEHDLLRFNLSHAGKYLLMALSGGVEIGVDLEIHSEVAYRGMAEHYLSPRERQDLFSLAPERQLAAFLRCWTRKEAYLKATGTGFGQPSTCFDVSLLPSQPPALLEHRTLPQETSRWSLTDVAVPDGYFAALAIEKH